MEDPSQPVEPQADPERTAPREAWAWKWEITPTGRLLPPPRPDRPLPNGEHHSPESILPQPEEALAPPVEPAPAHANPFVFSDDEWVWQTSESGEVWEYPGDEEEVAESPGSNWKAIVQEVAETAVLTLLIFVLMRALIQNYRIEGYSMEPNLHEHQYLIVNKVSYYLGEPQRGDIIVFEFPKGDPNGPEKDYIKRVIGLPGDTVECRPNEIVVNGEVIAEPYGPNPGSYFCAPTILGPEEYFVLGDNRNQSSDSHSWGALERKFIIGKAWLLYWPFSDMGWVPNFPIEAPKPEPLVRTP